MPKSPPRSRSRSSRSPSSDPAKSPPLDAWIENGPLGSTSNASDEADCPCVMCQAEAEGASPADIAQMLQAMQDTIDERVRAGGISLEYVLGAEEAPPWCYTIGRVARRLPELIVLGLDSQSAGTLLNRVDARWDRVTAGQQLGDHGPEIRLIPVPRRVVLSGEYLLGSIAYARRHGIGTPTLQQVVWADPSGAFPWEAECAPRYRKLQPIIGFGFGLN